MLFDRNRQKWTVGARTPKGLVFLGAYANRGTAEMALEFITTAKKGGMDFDREACYEIRKYYGELDEFHAGLNKETISAAKAKEIA